MFARGLVVVRVEHHWCVVGVDFERSPFSFLHLSSNASPTLGLFLGIVIDTDWPSPDAYTAQAFKCLLSTLCGDEVDEASRRISAREWIDGDIDIITDIGEYEAITRDDVFDQLAFQCSSS